MRTFYGFLTTILAIAAISLETAAAASYTSAFIGIGSSPSTLQARSAEILAARLREGAGVAADIGAAAGSPVEGRLEIVLGPAAGNAEVDAALAAARVAPPTVRDPGPEGYLVQLTAPGRLLAVGVEERSQLYAIGEVLRQCVWRDQRFEFPDQLEVRTAPAFEVRGTEVSQGVTMRELTGSREWTEEEWQRAVLDYVFAGANTFGIGHVDPTSTGRYDFLKSLGLKTLISVSANFGVGGPPEWEAVEAIGRRNYTCLSVPEARAAVLAAAEQRFQTESFHDYVRFYSGDGGGCECDECAPYGKTYIEMCEDLAAIIHKYHPGTVIVATNQKLDNAGEQAIIDYLQAEPRDWLKAIVYGPGSNAMGWMPGRRQDHRTDLFQYPRFGQMDGYLRELLHQLPPRQNLLLFTDLTHWVYSQYGLMDHAIIPDRNHEAPPAWDRALYERRPDPAMSQVYNRRTFHARPRAYYDVFRETARYTIGDSTYSEGIHDNINQWIWQRLLWAPNTPFDTVLSDYCRWVFGPEAAPIMAQAISQHEANLSTPIAANPGIDAFNNLILEARKIIGEPYLTTNYLWRMYVQRGLLDKYIQLRVRKQEELRDVVLTHLEDALKGDGDVTPAVTNAKMWLAREIEDDEMKKLREGARLLGDKSNSLYGVNNEGLFDLDQDFIGLGNIRKQVDLAAAAPDVEARRAIAHQLVHYEDPGEGGFYDDAGDPANSPHLVYGWTFGDGGFNPENRRSQNSAAFTTDEKKGVTFAYHDLDPATQYRVKLTLLRPKYLPRFADKQPQTAQSIYADEFVLAKELELPEYDAQFFEFDIPKAATQDGSLELWFEKQAGIAEWERPKTTVWRNTGGWGTLVSEVWLMKKTE